MSDDTPITREHAARLLGTSERHVRRLIQQGRLPTHPDARGTPLLLRSAVDAYETASREAVTQGEAAALLGVGRRTIRRMLDDGRLQAAPATGGHDRVTRQSLDTRLAAVPSAPDTTGHETDKRGHHLESELIDILSQSDALRPAILLAGEASEHDLARAPEDAEALVALLEPPVSTGQRLSSDTNGPTPKRAEPVPGHFGRPGGGRQPGVGRRRFGFAVALLVVACLSALAIHMTGNEPDQVTTPSPTLAASLPQQVARAHRLHPPVTPARAGLTPRARGGPARVLIPQTPTRHDPVTAPSKRPTGTPGLPPRTSPPASTIPTSTGCGLFVGGAGLC